MKIGIIGAGNIGATLARHFVRAGHEVALSNSRGPESLKPLMNELGQNARALTRDEVAGFGDVILLAVPWRREDAFPRPSSVAGRIVIDATNPYGSSGSVIDLGDDTSSEVVARRLPGARLVKAFNTLWFKHLADKAQRGSPLSERVALFLAGDDAEAKKVVASLIEDIGFAPVDTGSLREGGRRQQPGTPVYNRPMTAGEAKQVLSAATAVL